MSKNTLNSAGVSCLKIHGTEQSPLSLNEMHNICEEQMQEKGVVTFKGFVESPAFAMRDIQKTKEAAYLDGGQYTDFRTYWIDMTKIVMNTLGSKEENGTEMLLEISLKKGDNKGKDVKSLNNAGFSLCKTKVYIKNNFCEKPIMFRNAARLKRNIGVLSDESREKIVLEMAEFLKSIDWSQFRNNQMAYRKVIKIYRAKIDELFEKYIGVKEVVFVTNTAAMNVFFDTRSE